MESKTPSASTGTGIPRPPTAASARRPVERSGPPIDRSASHDPAVELHSRPSPPPWPEQPEATTDTHEGSPQKRRSLALSAPRPSLDFAYGWVWLRHSSGLACVVGFSTKVT